MTYKSLHQEHSGYLGKAPAKELQKFNIVDGKVVELHYVTVHEFRVNDSEDPDLYAAVPMLDWQNTEKGQWVMEHAVEAPLWYRNIDPVTFGYRYMIRARLRGPDHTFWQLKWGQNI